MSQRVSWIVTGVAICLAGVTTYRTMSSNARVDVPPALREDPAESSRADGPAVRPLPEPNDLDVDKVELGRKLFHDAGFSNDGKISCATCHQLDKGGVDGLRVSRGVGGQEGSINAPTVLNSRFNFRQFWDGRADTLEEQVEGPLLHPKEMHSDWATVLARISGDADYSARFAKAFTDGVTRVNVKDAIAEFERSLVTMNSPFDHFLRGDKDALNDEQKEGWKLFQELGCVTCHQGVNLGGNSFQSFGIAGNYFADRGSETVADLGRFNVTKNPRDRHRFKVPTLRNVELTAPYFHDGTVKTLDEAVRVMGRYQLGFDLNPPEIAKLVAFLKTLTGDRPVK